MIKNARTEVGKTPSPVSGSTSEIIKRGEAVRKDETVKVSLKKVAKSLGKLVEVDL